MDHICRAYKKYKTQHGDDGYVNNHGNILLIRYKIRLKKSPIFIYSAQKVAYSFHIIFIVTMFLKR